MRPLAGTGQMDRSDVPRRVGPDPAHRSGVELLPLRGVAVEVEQPRRRERLEGGLHGRPSLGCGNLASDRPDEINITLEDRELGSDQRVLSFGRQPVQLAVDDLTMGRLSAGSRGSGRGRRGLASNTVKAGSSSRA